MPKTSASSAGKMLRSDPLSRGLCACILHRFHDAIQSSVANFWWTTAADTVDSHLAGVFTFRVWGLYSRRRGQAVLGRSLQSQIGVQFDLPQGAPATADLVVSFAGGALGSR